MRRAPQSPFAGSTPFTKPVTAAFAVRFSARVVGVRGFEPPAPSSRTRCATRLRYTPLRCQSYSPAAPSIRVLIAAPWRAGKPDAQNARSLRSSKRPCRDSLVAASRTSSPHLPGNRVYATYARDPEIENRSGESCGSSVVEHSLGKGEAESSILSRSTTTFKAFVKTILDRTAALSIK